MHYIIVGHDDFKTRLIVPDHATGTRWAYFLCSTGWECQVGLFAPEGITLTRVEREMLPHMMNRVA